MFFGLQVDRGNLVQAVSDNLLDDLHLTTDGMFPTRSPDLPTRLSNSILMGGMPPLSRLQLRKHRLPGLLHSGRAALAARVQEDRAGPLDPHADLPLVRRCLFPVRSGREGQLLGHPGSTGTVGGTWLCCRCGSRSLLLTRLLPSLIKPRSLLTRDDTWQGGFIPDVILWLSYFYTSRELPIRLRYANLTPSQEGEERYPLTLDFEALLTNGRRASYFFTTLSVTGILTSLLAFAILRMRGILGWSGW